MNSGHKNLLAPLGTTALVAGQRVRIPLNRGGQLHNLFVELVAQLDVTVNTTGIINGGDLAACVRLFLNQNGEDIWQMEGSVASFLTQCYAPSLVDTRLVPATGNIQAATVLRSPLALYACVPASIVPRETAFLENDPRQALELHIELAAPAVNRILDMTAGTAAITLATAAVTQDYVMSETALPFLRPRYSERVVSVAGANAALLMELDTNHRLRGVVIRQEADVAGGVADIITALALRSDNGDYYGSAQMPWGQFVRRQQMEFGGGVAGPNATLVDGSMAFVNFQKYNRLSSVFYPYRDANRLRFEFNATPSVTANAVNSRIRLTLLELERPAPVQGRDLVSPTLPDFLAN